MSDPEEIAVEQAILDKIQDGDVELPNQMFKVAHRHFIRYRRLQRMPDLDKAISMATEAIKLTPNDHPNRTARIINLSVYWHEKFPGSDSTNVPGLEDSIQASRDAIASLPDTYPHRGTLLDQLSTKLGLLFMQTREVSVIEENIKIQREAIDVTPVNHPKHLTFFANLAAPITARYQALGRREDLDEAVDICRQVVEQTEKNSPHALGRLGNLSITLSDRFDVLGDIKDLDEAIEIVRRAIGMTEEGSLEQMAQLSNYGRFIGDRYLSTGNVADLDESIRTLQKVCDRIQDDEIFFDRPRCLTNLGIQLSRRYRKKGTIADLKKAIAVCRKACKVVPNDDLQRCFSNLAITLKHEYFRTDDAKVLDEAIYMQREAVRTVPENHSDLAAAVHNLAALLWTRFSARDKIEDLEEALSNARQAVSLTPKEHLNRAAYLNTLAMQLRDMSRKTGVDSHMHEAIDHGRAVLEATQKGHPEQANRLVAQGIRYGDLFWKANVQEYLASAIEHFESALHSCNCHEDCRIGAAKELFKYYAAVPDWEKAYKAAEIAVALIPKLIASTTNNADKQDVLVQIYGVASDAAAVAISAGKGGFAALKFLEQGRGMLAASVEETRIEVGRLEKEHPVSAKRFTELRSEIETSKVVTDLNNLSPKDKTPASLANCPQTHNVDALLDDIRHHPGFEDFLTAPTENTVKNAASRGPIIVINVSHLRRDAILVERDQIRSIPLPQLTIQDLKSNSQEIHTASPKVLEWLWDTIAEPVLNALGIHGKTAQGPVQRIWWTPTGILSIYPLHAAGRHYKGSSETVMDRAMSSYSSSVKAIVRSRGRAGLDRHPEGLERAVLVSMGRTPGHSTLPSAGKEVTMLRPICESKGFDVVEPKPVKKAVVSELPQCKIFHFAGHGSTNGPDPSQSTLLLEDWQKDPLTVSTLLDINIQQYSPFLAYLSACGTGQIAHEKFLDESIHLISAFQVAGFRHVIGTLWEVGDDISVDVARITYEAIQGGEKADESVCKGLHKAILNLREQWFDEQAQALSRKRKARTAIEGRTKGQRDPRDVVAVDDEEDEDDVVKLPQWVPYVHYGV
ncbi:CHAT domain-containing protein [Fusarium flagelliforme]|uniref:30s ribosomal protein s17p-like protein n=1 Tax=Fusarium flagelliforme TaxID=2675880 RepID=A0A395N1P1_9HYPO|nr:CHAT domain-containing protein [Fusarium flagelliforme]KAH7188043.1 CHAT domain-containing protein [Fusarium flagelliforme]RFN53895.1 30s ribosomal protein s17p-like protein [Fusarium flagelliforme]